MNKEENKHLVTQSNELLEAQYSSNLTALAHKIAKLIISLINPKGEENNLSIPIEIETIKYYLGWTKGSTWNRFQSDLKDVAKRLNKEPITIKLDKKKTLVTFFLSSYTIDIEKEVIHFSIAPKLVPYLTNLKQNFTSYQLKYIPSLKSSYAIRIYELFHQYKKIGKRTFLLTDFIKLVGAPLKYRYNDIKKRVIIPAQQQLKENTDIAFIFNEYKTGRSVTSVEFIIFSNQPTKRNEQQVHFLQKVLEIEKSQEEAQDKAAFPEQIIQKLNEIGISEQNIAKYITKGFDIISSEKKRKKAIEKFPTIGDYYLDKMNLLTAANTIQNKANPAGFLIQALREDWTKAKIERTAPKQQKAKSTKANIQKNIKTIEKQIATLNNQKSKLVEPVINILFKDKATIEKTYDSALEKMGDFFKRTHQELLTKPILEQYQSNPFIKSYMKGELYNLFPNKFLNANDLQTKIDQLQTQLQTIKNT